MSVGMFWLRPHKTPTYCEIKTYQPTDQHHKIIENNAVDNVA